MIDGEIDDDDLLDELVTMIELVRRDGPLRVDADDLVGLDDAQRDELSRAIDSTSCVTVDDARRVDM